MSRHASASSGRGGAPASPAPSSGRTVASPAFGARGGAPGGASAATGARGAAPASTGGAARAPAAAAATTPAAAAAALEPSADGEFRKEMLEGKALVMRIKGQFEEFLANPKEEDVLRELRAINESPAYAAVALSVLRNEAVGKKERRDVTPRFFRVLLEAGNVTAESIVEDLRAFTAPASEDDDGSRDRDSFAFQAEENPKLSTFLGAVRSLFLCAGRRRAWGGWDAHTFTRAGK